LASCLPVNSIAAADFLLIGILFFCCFSATTQVPTTFISSPVIPVALSRRPWYFDELRIGRMNPTIKGQLFSPSEQATYVVWRLSISIIFVRKLRTIEAGTLLKFKK